MSVQEDDSVCLQSESFRDVCPQSLHSLPSGDSELHRAAGGGGDGQTHGGLISGDFNQAACRPTQAEATEPPDYCCCSIRLIYGEAFELKIR